MRSAVLAAATIAVLHVLAQEAHSNEDAHVDKRTWRIGCADAATCSYYDDQKAMSRRDATPDTPGTSDVLSDSKSDSGELHGRDAASDKDDDRPVHGSGEISNTAKSLSPRDLVAGEKYLYTRCKPGDDTIIEKVEDGKPSLYFECPRRGSCFDLGGRGACYVGDDHYMLPSRTRYLTFRCKDPRQPDTCYLVNQSLIPADSPSHRDKQALDHTLSSNSSKSRRTTKQVPRDLSYRCAPDHHNVAQYQSLLTDSWIDFHTCFNNGVCLVQSGQMQCWDGKNSYIPIFNFELPVPTPLPVAPPPEPRISEIVNKIASEDIHIRCDPEDEPRSLVQYSTGESWHTFYSCRGTCESLDDMVVCKEHPNQYSIPYPSLALLTARGTSSNNSSASFKPRQAPKKLDFHTIDTRCDPHNLSEIQAMRNGTWEFHYSCTFKGACVDVDGHGACRLKGNVFELPAANFTSIAAGEPENPLRVRTKCNPLNETEVLEWNGQAYAFNGVCPPPFICHDFGDNADLAFCAHEDLKMSHVWLPWPSLTAPSQNGLMTRCRSKRDVDQFNGREWVTYQRCPDGFKCEVLGTDPRNGGCVAPHISGVDPMPDVPRKPHHAQRDVPEHLPLVRRHYQNSLFEISEQQIAQGEHLADEGHELITEGETLDGAIFDPDASLDSDPADILRPSDAGLVDDSANLESEGQYLKEEGDRLLDQGRQLLQVIFGNRTDEFIANITSSLGAARDTTTGAAQARRIDFRAAFDDGEESSDDEPDCHHPKTSQ